MSTAGRQPSSGHPATLSGSLAVLVLLLAAVLMGTLAAGWDGTEPERLVVPVHEVDHVVAADENEADENERTGNERTGNERTGNERTGNEREADEAEEDEADS